MGKINSIFKTIVAVAIVLVMAQGCVPAGGNTPTSGTFNVGIDDEYFLYTEPHINFSTKILEIDGDSICFAIMKADNFHIQRYFGIYTKSSDGNVYEFLSYGNSDLMHPLQGGKTISNLNDSNFIWNTNLTTYLDGWIDVTIYERFDHHFGVSGSSVSPYVPLTTSATTNFLFEGTNYFVFRKLKTTGYQYFWIKLINLSPLNMAVYGRGEFFRVETGKYQMNSIVTGQ